MDPVPKAPGPPWEGRILAQGPISVRRGLPEGLCALLLLGAFFALGAEVTDEPSSGEAILQRLEGRYASLPGLKAGFVQVWRPGRFGDAVEERGVLWIRRPGMARWEYYEPERKVAVLTPEGETWFYMPADRQAVHGRLKGDLPPHLALLMGEARLGETFRLVGSRIGQPGAGVAGLAVLTLEPVRSDAAALRVVLTVETDPVRLRSVVVEGEGGEQTEYILLEVEEGSVGPESLFRFSPPEGVDILEEAPADPEEGPPAGE